MADFLLEDRRREAGWVNSQLVQLVGEWKSLEEKVEELKMQHDTISAALSAKITETEV